MNVVSEVSVRKTQETERKQNRKWKSSIDLPSPFRETDFDLDGRMREVNRDRYKNVLNHEARGKALLVSLPVS